MNIGKQVKVLRVQKNVKQEELANYLGVSYQAVSKWETEMSLPDITLLPKLATYFGVSIDELFQMPNEEQFERIENIFGYERRIKSETFDHEVASEYAKKVLEVEPENKKAWVAYLEANEGACGDEWFTNHFAVIEYFKGFLEKNPKSFLGYYAIIENLLDDDRYDEAVFYIEKLKEVRNNYQFNMYMGDVAYGKGDLEKAKNLWNKSVEEYPNTWQAYCSRADRYKKIGMIDEALKDYEVCFTIQKAPRITDGLHSLAQMHERMSDYKMAIEDRKRIIQCLKEDYQVVSGEGIERQKREIERLKVLLNK